MPAQPRNVLAAMLLFAGALPLLAQTPAATPSAHADTTVQRLLDERTKARRSVGIAAGLYENGNTRLFFSGSTATGGKPVDGNSVFEIGSITKVFTGALLADMVQRGEVKLSDPVSKFLPTTVRMPSRNGRQITLRDLATQTSGLPRLPSNMSPANPENPYANYTVEQMYAFLSGYELPRDVGATYEYSNLGVGLLGHVLALRLGKSYEQLLTERILAPLGMNDTRITMSPSMRARLARGHSDVGEPTGNWDLPTVAGAGALRSTVNDMLKFVAANLDTTSRMGRVLATARASAYDIELPRRRIGLAWHITDALGTTMVWHNGGTGGYRSFLGLDEAGKKGVIVLSNQQYSVDDIGGHLLNARAPLTPVTPLAVRTAVTLPPATLDRYVGEYQLAPTFIITITREGNALFAQATGQPKFGIFPEAEGKFFFRVVDAQLTFVADSSGRVTSLTLHQNGRDTPATRIK